MNIPLIIAMGGPANQGAAILISWAAGISTIAIALIGCRTKKKSLQIFAVALGAFALIVSGIVAHLFGWRPGHIISATILLLPIVLEVCGITLGLRSKNA